jgi:hypothetical protein
MEKINLDLLKRLGGNILAFIVFYAVLMFVLGFIYGVVYEVGSDLSVSGTPKESIEHFGITGKAYLEFMCDFGIKPLIFLLWTIAGAAVLALPTLAFIGVYLEFNKK